MARYSVQRTRGTTTVLLAALMVGALAPRFAPRTSDVDEVWSMEDRYWRYVQAGDLENYRTLCHDPHPATKPAIGNWVKEIRDQKIRFSYSLTREGASNVGGVVVVYYQTPMIWKYPDGQVEGRQDLPRKFTHTWLKVNGAWQIIGGMCGADAPRS
jgi:hypothetical protein